MTCVAGFFSRSASSCVTLKKPILVFFVCLVPLSSFHGVLNDFKTCVRKHFVDERQTNNLCFKWDWALSSMHSFCLSQSSWYQRSLFSLLCSSADQKTIGTNLNFFRILSGQAIQFLILLVWGRTNAVLLGWDVSCWTSFDTWGVFISAFEKHCREKKLSHDTLSSSQFCLLVLWLNVD